MLHYLSFAVLSDGARWRCADYTLTVLPSASSLPFIQANSGRSSAPPLVLGNPVTDEPDLPTLPFATREVPARAGLDAVKTLLGAAASAEALCAGASGARILHLAAHGRFNPVAPLAAALYLAPDPPAAAAGAYEPARLVNRDTRLRQRAVRHVRALADLPAWRTSLSPPETA